MNERGHATPALAFARVMWAMKRVTNTLYGMQTATNVATVQMRLLSERMWAAKLPRWWRRFKGFRYWCWQRARGR